MSTTTRPPAGTRTAPVNLTARGVASRPATVRAPGGRLTPGPDVDPDGPPGLQIADWADPRWVDRIENSCVLFFDRASSEHSGPAITQTVQGLYEGIEWFATRFGIDAKPAVDAIGGRAELERRLRHDSVLHLNDSLDPGARTIRTWTLVVDELRAQGILIALQTGSGTKIDAAYHQPAAFWLASSVIREYQPGVLFSREWPRTGRDGFAMGPVVYELRHIAETTGQVPAIGAMTNLPLQEVTDETEDALFRQGQAGRQEVKWFAQRSALARQKTGIAVRHGRVPYAGNHPPPPGTASAVVLPGAFPEGGPEDWPDVSLKPGKAHYLYLDTPACRPEPVLVFKSMSQIRLPDGSPAPDQVENVIWLLAHLGTRDENGQIWDQLRCAHHLVAHGYSTEALRNLHQRSDAVWTLDHTSKDTVRVSARNLCRSILDHCDEYETGTFIRAMPGGKGDTVSISGLLPPSGRWVTPERAAELRAYLAALDPSPNRPAMVFSGLEVTLNGDAAWLEATVRGGPPRYHFCQRDGHRAGSHPNGRHAPIPPMTHDFLQGLLGEAFKRDVPLPRLAPADSPVPDLEATARAAHERVDQLETKQRARLTRLDRDDIPSRTRAALVRLFEDGEVELDGLREAAGTAQKELDKERARPPIGVADERLIDLLRGLADSRSGQARKLLFPALTLSARHEVITEPGHVPRHRVEVTIELAIHDGRDTFVLSARGAYEGGPAAKVLPRLAAAVDGLRHGVALADTLGSDWHRWLPQIRAALGPAGRTTRAHLVDDPRLRRLHMAVRHPPCPDPGPDPHHPRLAGPPLTDEALVALAHELGEPVELLRRIDAVFGALPPGHKWVRDASGVVGSAHLAAADTGWVRPGDLGRVEAGYQLLHGPFGPEWRSEDGMLELTPCAGCGGTNRVPLRLREAAGSVCAVCRTDRSGVLWPPKYDRYTHPTR